MAKPPKLPISQTKSSKWRYDLPPLMSDSGKRQRKIFNTRMEAEFSRTKDLERHRLYGIEGHSISSSLATEASKAQDILKPTGASLIEAAAAYLKTWEQAQQSRTFAQVWQIREDELIGKSQSHQSKNSSIGRKLIPIIGSQLVCEIQHDAVREVLTECYPTAHGYNLALRHVKPIFTLAVQEGWAIENPCDRLKPRDTGRHKVQTLNLNQCRKLMSSALDFRQKEDWPENLKVDARGSMAALALQLFAGIRPTETTRLDWQNINMADGTVFVSNEKAKTDRSRFFDMPDTLKTWLDTIPTTERVGSICPSNWRRCWQAIRREAGISEARDQLRKTFATCHLMAFGDVNATREIMGHEHGDVLFKNYRGLVSKADAIKFWSILPEGEQIQIKAVG